MPQQPWTTFCVEDGSTKSKLETKTKIKTKTKRLRKVVK